jgi:hypothetical protein
VRFVVAATVLCCLPAWARPGAGTLSDPLVIDAFPYVAAGDTSGGTHAVDGYSCAAQSEAGPERVYRFTLDAPARVTAWVEAASPVDVDVHLLDDAALSGKTASSCVARADIIAEAQMDAGEHWLIVDSYVDDSNAGPYVLHVEAIGDAWITRPLADGVSWRARRFAGVGGGPQVVHELVVDPKVSTVNIKALRGTGCQTIGDLGTQAGALAGVNGGYFDTGATGCAPVSLLKASGTLIGQNGSTSMRGAFGMSPSKQPLVALVAGASDWPAAHEAHGGGPILAQAGTPRAGQASWSTEGFMSSSFLGINPRTYAGFDAAGLVHLGTVDGRRTTTTAVGMSMDALAAFVTSAEIDLADAVNLDGGGSSTTWVKGATPNGVVNYPSDAGATELATHPGSRGVSGGLFVFATPLNHPPRFQTQPPTDAAVGTPYSYDADAIDLDIGDVVAFRLESPPPGVVVDAEGVVTFQPAVDLPPVYAITLTAFDGRGGETQQSWTVAIAGAMGETDDGMLPSEPDGAAASPDFAVGGGGDVQGGCSIAHRPSPAPWLLLVLFFRRRKHA